MIHRFHLFIAMLAFLAVNPAHSQYRNPYTDRVETLHAEARGAMLAGNYAIAYCIWQPLANQGDHAAQYNIGWMYHNGYGLSIDDESALYWWLQAATSGYADAHFALGDLYAHGQGVDRNMAIALGWYISAALKDHEPARETLMTLLSSDDPLILDTFRNLLKNDWKILGQPMEVIVDKANTRRGPGTDHPVVTTLERGHQVIPIKEQNGWTYIGITGLGRTAWIFNRLIAHPAGIYAVENLLE